MEALKKPKPSKSLASSSTTSAKPKTSSVLSALQAAAGRPASTSSSLFDIAEDPEDDDDEENDANVETKVEETPAAYAPVVLANATKNGSSVLSWVKAQEWNRNRNQRECTAIGAAIDALISEGVDRNGEGLEILCRRLSGVHAADKYGNWKVCQAVEYPYSSESLLSQQLLSKAVKDAAALDRLEKRANNNNASSSKRRNYNNNNNNNNNRNSSSFKSKFGVGSKTAGAAQQ